MSSIPLAAASRQIGEAILDQPTPVEPQLTREISATEGGTGAVNRPYHDGQRLNLSSTCPIGSLAGCKEGSRGPDDQMAFWGWEEPRQAAPSLPPAATLTHIHGFFSFERFPA